MKENIFIDCGRSTYNDSLYFLSICVNLKLPPNMIQGFSVYSNHSVGAARNLNLPPNPIQDFWTKPICNRFHDRGFWDPTLTSLFFQCTKFSVNLYSLVIKMDKWMINASIKTVDFHYIHIESKYNESLYVLLPQSINNWDP